MKLHPLVERLLAEHGAACVTAANLDDWQARAGAHVLYLGGDPVQFPEALDVAVVLPELAAAAGGAFDIGVVPRAEEEAVARRFGVQRWPTLVLLRDGGYLAALSGMRDWSDYVAAVRDALALAPRRVPSIGIPLVAADAGAGSACH